MSKTQQMAGPVRDAKKPAVALPALRNGKLTRAALSKLEAVARSRQADIASAVAQRIEEDIEHAVARRINAGAARSDAPDPTPVRPVYELLGAISAMAFENAQRVADVSDALVAFGGLSCPVSPQESPCVRLIGEQLAQVLAILQWTGTRLDEMHAALHGGSPAGLRAADQFAMSR